MNLNDLSTICVIRRNGEVVDFDATKIRNAIVLAYLKDADGEPRHPGDLTLSASEREKVERFTEQVVAALLRHRDVAAIVRIEDIQDQVELALMRAGEHDVARDYVLYRARLYAALGQRLRSKKRRRWSMGKTNFPLPRPSLWNLQPQSAPVLPAQTRSASRNRRGATSTTALPVPALTMPSCSRRVR